MESLLLLCDVAVALLKLADEDRFLLMRLERSEEGDEVDEERERGLAGGCEPLDNDEELRPPMLIPPLLDGLLPLPVLERVVVLFCVAGE